MQACRLRRPLIRFAVALATTVVLLLASAAARADDEQGFEPLFNGQDLAGWVAMGEAGFEATDAGMRTTGSGDYPTWLRSEEVFENFVLRFDFRLGLYGESGVFLHAPLHGRVSRIGFEIQLSDDTRTAEPAGHSTGAVFGAVPPLMHASRPLGDWNSMEIYFVWPQLRVTINGEVVQDLSVEEHPDLRHRLRFGHLGFQDRGKQVDFRNVRIKRLPDDERPRWRPLFNGRNFDGWSVVHPEGASWRVEEDQIVAEDGDGYLVSEEEFQDFDLQFYALTTPLANGGVFIRWKSLVPRDRGNEIQIEDVSDSNNPTGSVYDVARAVDWAAVPGEWNLIQVRVEGNRARVCVNGVVAAETDRLAIIRPGHIALQMHSRGKTIRFKDVWIRPRD